MEQAEDRGLQCQDALVVDVAPGSKRGQLFLEIGRCDQGPCLWAIRQLGHLIDIDVDAVAVEAADWTVGTDVGPTIP